jgi:hypothetical protein
MFSVRGRDIAGLRCPTERAALRNVIYCVVSQSRISWASCWEALGVHFPQLKMRTYRLSLDVTGEKGSIVVSWRFHCTSTDTYFLKPQQQLKRRGEAHRLKRQVEAAAAVQHQWQAGAPSRSNIWNRAHNVLSHSLRSWLLLKDCQTKTLASSCPRSAYSLGMYSLLSKCSP